MAEGVAEEVLLEELLPYGVEVWEANQIRLLGASIHETTSTMGQKITITDAGVGLLVLSMLEEEAVDIHIRGLPLSEVVAKVNLVLLEATEAM